MEYLTRYDPEEILIVSGDHIYYMDYAPMIAFHKRNRADLTVAMMEVPKRTTGSFRDRPGERAGSNQRLGRKT